MLLVLPVARLGLPSMRGSNERTPADGSAGVADGGSCCAHAVNSRPMRAELSDELGAMAFKHPWASDCIGERPGGKRCFALADMPPQ